MLTPQLLAAMSDDRLVAVLHTEFNPLTASAAEVELLKRFKAALESRNDQLDSALDDYEFSAKNIIDIGDAIIQNTDNTVALLKAIGDAGIDSPEELKATLDRAEQFTRLASDAGDVFNRLSQLATTTQEN